MIGQNKKNGARDRKRGKAFIYRVFRVFPMEPAEGFEPPTSGLQNRQPAPFLLGLIAC